MGIWHVLFLLAAYSSFLVCIYAAYRIGKERGWAWGLAHLLVFFGFIVLFWLMESYAASRTPYFSYPLAPAGLPDTVGFHKFPYSPIKNWCQVLVPENVRIPISVLLLEATLTFAAGHTARLLADNKELRFRLLRPFMVALALLLFDFLLDPLASTSQSCLAGSGSPPPLEPGLGFWEWYVVPGIGPDAFGVPLFNYVLWFSMPVVLIALIGWIDWFYDDVLDPIVLSGGGIQLNVLLEGAFLTLIIFAFTLIIMMSPNFASLPIGTLRAIFIGLLLLTLLGILAYARFFNYRNDFRWWFVYPQAVFLLFSVVAFLLSGLVTQVPQLLLVAFVVAPLFVVWMISPYWKTIFP